MKKIQITFFAIVFLLIPILSSACSMYKITQNGKTIVGNNEDWLSPNSQFWFEAPSENKFGVMYMGLLNNFAQGAINDAGLVFDGFTVPYLPIENTKGKIEITITEAIKKVMQTMDSVEEVKSYLKQLNLSSLSSSMLVFVDKSGTYLIVEGDEMFIGEESEKSFSNFYYSQIESEDKVNLDYFQRGQKHIQSTQGKPTLNYCGEVMEKFAGFKLASTQYSTIYDLNTLKIRIYLFHDYSQFVELDLKKELKKGNHRTMIADLFPKESVGNQHYQKYNDIEHPTSFLEEMIGSDSVSEAEFISMGFSNVINIIGNEWLKDKNNPEVAVKVFEYGVKLMPNDANLYDRLGETYFLNKDWDKSIKNYAKSLTLNTDNENAIEMISKVSKNRKESKVD